MEKEEAVRQRRIRNAMYDVEASPYGDKKVDPSRSRTAAEYSDYLSKSNSFHIQSGAHLNMLEQEEVAMGNISYPPGHPHRVSLEAGRDPNVDELKASGRWPSSPHSTSGTGFEDREVPLTQTAAPAAPRAASPLRTNRHTAVCAKGDGSVAPGEGRLVRDPEKGWVTVHNHHVGD